MEISFLNSLRLGFSTSEADEIRKKGIDKVVKDQLQAPNLIEMPQFLTDAPKNLSELRFQNQLSNGNPALKKQQALSLFKTEFDWKCYVMQRVFESRHPLREKINLFFQNHFVSTLQSVRLPYWIFLQYQSINQFSTKNYKDLVREMVYSNALIKYLDNQQNRKGKINENLARELLELFTLGEGHYSELDIKNTAKALAGLSFGVAKGQYRPALKDNSQKTFKGKTGNFDVNDIIDMIFESAQPAYFLTEKVLKWFFYDQPAPQLIKEYGDYLVKKKYELLPFFQRMMEQECKKKETGNQIKNPLIFVVQLFKDLQLKPHYPLMVVFLKNQSMDLFDQINVKGWKGGQDWLSAQGYTQRIKLIDFLISGNKRLGAYFNKRLLNIGVEPFDFQPKYEVQNRDSAQQILEEMTEKLVFQSDDEMWSDLNQILKYDFDPQSENAEQHILQVYSYLCKSPEFQII